MCVCVVEQGIAFEDGREGLPLRDGGLGGKLQMSYLNVGGAFLTP